MIRENYKESFILWQDSAEDGVPEPAILVNVYGDIISLDCGDNSINVNYESINELCKLLKQVKKKHDEQ
jgi:hypothetical protein